MREKKVKPLKCKECDKPLRRLQEVATCVCEDCRAIVYEEDAIADALSYGPVKGRNYG